MHSRCSKISAIVLCAFAAATVQAASPTYRIEVLPKANGIVPRSAGGISDNGNVAGVGRQSGSTSTVAYLAKGGRDPQPLAGSKNGGGYAYDVNDAGEVLGSYVRYDGDGDTPGPQGALWTSDGQLHDLEQLVGCDMSLPDDYSSPNALNEAGDMVFMLSCTTGGTLVDTSVLLRDGVMTVLPALGGDLNWSSDINNHGEITGSAENSSGWMTAYTWKDGVMKSLGTLGGPSSWGSVINDHGHVAGSTTLANWRSRAFLYDGTTMRALPLCESSHVASPVGLTNDNLVVGVYGGRKNRRTVLFEDGQCKLLTDLLDSSGANWTSLYARDVNNHGVIVGEGLYQGKQRAFIATPLSR